MCPNDSLGVLIFDHHKTGKLTHILTQYFDLEVECFFFFLHKKQTNYKLALSMSNLNAYSSESLIRLNHI